eukprot:GFUD01009689.1.p1 GENE.GFUD01009689.1~~GFUD01009689.1.p1  ORF type:complete len:581 (+),score=181.10 GFUD01009689.1:50-1744(+)
MSMKYISCPLCTGLMGLTLPGMTEHLERKHLLLTSAAVLASNMFANSQAFEEVRIILKEFDEKNASIEHKEKNKIAAIELLSKKDIEINVLNEEVNELKKLAANKTEALQKIEDEQERRQDKLILWSTELSVFEDKLKCEKEMEAENAELKESNKSLQIQLRSLEKGVVDERRSFNFRIDGLTTELVGTKENLESLKRENEIIKKLCESWKQLVEAGAESGKEILRLRKSLESERMTCYEETENQREEILELKVKNASLSSVMKAKCENESIAENAQVKDCVEAQQNVLKTLKTRVVAERSVLNLKVASLTTELFQTKETLEGLKKENEVSKNNYVRLQNLCIKLEMYNLKMCVEASALRKNLDEMKMSMDEEEVRSSKVVADLNKQIVKLRITIKNKDVNMNMKNSKRKVLARNNTKKIEDMLKCFDDEKVCLENTLARKESEVDKLRNEFRHALIQANLLNSDLNKHQQNLVEHFQTILKARKNIKNTSNWVPGADGSVMKMYEEVVDSAVKSLVVDSVGQQVLKLSSEIESLHNYLSDKTTSGEDVFAASESREDNNNNLG